MGVLVVVGVEAVLPVDEEKLPNEDEDEEVLDKERLPNEDEEKLDDDADEDKVGVEDVNLMMSHGHGLMGLDSNPKMHPLTRMCMGVESVPIFPVMQTRLPDLCSLPFLTKR